jgi:tRNA dimethylallyltransferase
MTGDHLAILGPTCSWKSETALLLAEHLGAEIVNCDSMQIYRGMDIGTGKPSPPDRGRVPHHLVDSLDLGDRCDASTYVGLAEAVLRALEGRGRRAILAGGTGLYARSLIYGLHPLPADSAVAADLEAELARPGGLACLREELRGACVAAGIPAAVLQNPRRLVRALEVLRLTGAPPWLLQRVVLAPVRRRFRQYLLLPDLAVLRPRIERRTAQWLDQGWIEEVRALLPRGLLRAPTARHALGYAEIADFLAGRIATRSELQAQIVRATVRYARRQRTWFRHQHPGAVTVCIQRDTTAAELAETILAHGADSGDGSGLDSPATLHLA